MNWNEQSQAMMRSWSETQKKLWEGWTSAGPKPKEGGDRSWAQWLSQWRESAAEHLREWTAGTQGVPRAVAERMFMGEDLFLRFVDQAYGAFRLVAPQIEAGGDWVQLLRRYVDQLKGELTRSPAPWFTPEAAAAVARDVPELWKLYLTQLKELGVPWTRSLGDVRGHLGDAMTGDRQAVVKMYNLFMDTFENTLGRFLAAPAIGYTREFQEKVTLAFETWVEVRRAEVEFQTEVVNTGIRSLEALVRELVEKAERGERVASYRELFDIWVATAEKAYFEIAGTDSFAEIQARLVNSAMQYRIRERAVIEDFVKAMHLPTRRELDDAYRHLHELRQEVKYLRKEVTLLRTAKPVAESPESRPVAAKAQRRSTGPAAGKRGTKNTRTRSGTAKKTAATDSKKEG